MLLSHSARGAWIETILVRADAGTDTVALREGCVDRNLAVDGYVYVADVALREGCVDRNYSK